MRKQIFMIFTFSLIYAGIFRLTTGRFDWGRGWLYIGLTACGGILSMAIVAKKNPEVLARRSKMQRGTKTFDKIFLAFYMPMLLAVPFVGGLDAGRYGWKRLPFWTLYPGLLTECLAMVPIIRALSVNRFAEATVRIQADRGHIAITEGPYRFVRHPMYVGLILGVLAAPPILGSGWAFVPAAVTAALIVVRTMLEDSTLRSGLAGYEEYVQRTRYRLLPGVW
jgi:protein-S-isoprenylcysteine O-methyltransferase Ste14